MDFFSIDAKNGKLHISFPYPTLLKVVIVTENCHTLIVYVRTSILYFLFIIQMIFIFSDFKACHRDKNFEL